MDNNMDVALSAINSNQAHGFMGFFVFSAPPTMSITVYR